MKILQKRSVCSLFLLVLSLSCVVGQRCNGGADCIRLDECTGLYNQLRNPTPELSQLLRGLHCGFDRDVSPKVCCQPEFLAVSLPKTNPVDPLTLLPDSKTCGIMNNDSIVGGVQTDIDEHPWMALLRYDKLYGWGFYCGGVLINQRYVLTAAHCVGGRNLPHSWNLAQVRLGEWDTSTSKDCIQDDCTAPVQDIPIEEIIQHERYNASDIDQLHDIALLRLTRNAEFTNFVKPICLPLTTDLKQNSFQGYKMEVAGWGKTVNRSESNVKLKTQVPVVKNRDCGTVFAKVNRQIKDTQICAGGVGGRDSCRGDSGGPLMGSFPPANNWFVFGVVSYGPSPCGIEGWPGVYTRVGSYVDWILSKIRP